MINDKIPPLTIFCFLILSAGCHHSNTSTGNNINHKTPVTITAVSTGFLFDTLDLNAVSVFMKKNIIKSAATGVIENVNINIGDMVNEGQVLFTIKTKEASVLSESKITADSNFVIMGLIKIKATKTGVITSLSHQKGDYIQEGDELAVISEEGSLVFMMEVPFELRSYIRINDFCDIRLPDNEIIRGTIIRNLPVMDMSSQIENFIVKPLAAEKLPENLIAKIKILRSFNRIAVTLPKQAVLSDETQTEFWVMKLINDTTAIKIPVIKGIETSDKIEVTRPVFKETDRILLTGNYGLADTAIVFIKK